MVLPLAVDPPEHVTRGDAAEAGLTPPGADGIGVVRWRWPTPLTGSLPDAVHWCFLRGSPHVP